MLLQSPVSGSMPGDNGEVLVFGFVGGERGLYLVELEPLSLTKLPIEVHDLNLNSASWSPTGSHLAFTRWDRGREENGLWVHEMASGETRRLRTAQPGEEYGGVSWSPSGSELVVGTIHETSGDDGWRAGLIRVTPDGSLVDEISLPANFVYEVEWSPTGSEFLLWLSWVGDPYIWNGPNRTCLLSIDTKDLDCIVNDGIWPSWSPDGMHIALNIDGLTIVDRTGSVVQEFVPELDGRMTTWSPDGRFIAYPSYVGEWDEFEPQQTIELVDLDTLQRHAYVAGVTNVLDMWWRPLRPASGFVDVPDSHGFAADVAWLNGNGYTEGCNPPLSTLFCTDTHVTRGQTAAFLNRALNGIVEPAGDPIDFTDDDDSTFVNDIAWLSAAGITKGCNPPTNDRFCPDAPVTRGQMAAFLVRALGYTDDDGGDLFVDDDDSIFETDIDKLATAGVTRGCNPPVNDRFCPTSTVTRGQMAAFLHRALG